ncbi:helix-turn-helix domain-containing protein [Candidatus Enterococcus ferrettii]|uniref:HTH cro/C1-type domain-containing protein n=1 Tax=Candidatus Enterococcus ferrettii TaxID=2815324 RepID=A0ABV0ET36_9ENTE|nr:helix-turn-helix transcriptional regulator [Enterococcus sp. 665A]MBO1342608.1 helix-turn-helix transcriptional regulator [Enterococcus sp. 665A]
MRMNLGSVIAEKRKEKRITQQELAEFMSVSKASVSKWETGQTYPDITSLPLLAAYFDISIDELLNYEPQLSTKEIQHIYISLKKSFETKSSEEVLASVQSFVRRYYSCYPLVLQMGMLIINHFDKLPGKNQKEKQQVYLKEALDLFIHVRTQAKEPELIIEASRFEAYVLLTLQEPDQVLEILGEHTPVNFPIESMIAAAFQMKGRNERSVETMQSALYQYVTVVMSLFTNYLHFLIDQPEKMKETIKRAQQFVAIFDLGQLNPISLMNFQLSAVHCLIQQHKETAALELLNEWLTVLENTKFPAVLHGDDYFDQLDVWFESLETGNQLPRNSMMVREQLIEVVLLNPMIQELKDQERVQQIFQRLEQLRRKHNE